MTIVSLVCPAFPIYLLSFNLPRSPPFCFLLSVCLSVRYFPQCSISSYQSTCYVLELKFNSQEQKRITHAFPNHTQQILFFSNLSDYILSLSPFLPLFLPSSLPIFLSPSLHLSISPYSYPSLPLSISPSLHIYIHLFLYTSLHLSISISISSSLPLFLLKGLGTRLLHDGLS